jgi:hypothetical protein
MTYISHHELTDEERRKEAKLEARQRGIGGAFVLSNSNPFPKIAHPAGSHWNLGQEILDAMNREPK